jgi:hypothetical protein
MGMILLHFPILSKHLFYFVIWIISIQISFIHFIWCHLVTCNLVGQLLGLDIGSTLEVTNCFPFPNRVESFEDSDATTDLGAEYQIEMMRLLRDVNVDSNTVGWYQV